MSYTCIPMVFVNSGQLHHTKAPTITAIKYVYKHHMSTNDVFTNIFCFIFQTFPGTSMDGHVMDYFEAKGPGFQYVNLRNDAGAGELMFLFRQHITHKKSAKTASEIISILSIV